MDLKIIVEKGVFCLAVLGFLAAVYMAYDMHKKKKTIGVLTPVRMLFGAVIVAGVLLYIPAYYGYLYCVECVGGIGQFLKAVLMAVYSTVRLFMCDGDFSVVHDSGMDGGVVPCYVGFLSLLQVAAPALTAGAIAFVLSNLFSGVKYWMSRGKDILVFSELNEGSLNLAQDLKKNHSKSAVLFAGFDPEKTSDELKKKARDMDAILFTKDVTELPLDKHSEERSIWFFAIAQDEQTNISHGLQLVKKYGNRERTNLYVFADSKESEALFSTQHAKKIVVRRVSLVRSAINRMLYDEGVKLFNGAAVQPDGKKIITAVVVGMNKYGNLMAKTLTWFCQMEGYHFRLYLFDPRRDGEDRFTMECPELMHEDYNGIVAPGKSSYTIKYYSGVRPNTKTFADHIAALKDVTYVLVDQGRDDRNVETAMTLRMLFARSGEKPEIQVAIGSSEKKAALKDLKCMGKPYDLTFLGDTESCYTESVILNSDIEANGLRVHMQYCAGKDGEKPTEEQKEQHRMSFWGDEYNYRSSVAAAIAGKVRKELGIGGADKLETEWTDDERKVLQPLEHRRWNAYMRSEGYVLGKGKNHLARTHDLLIDYSALPEKEKIKDALVSSDG